MTVAALLLFCPEPALPQVMGLTLDSGQFEVGYTRMDHKRLLENWGTTPVAWGTTVPYVRYAVADWLTLSLEGFLVNSGSSEKFPLRDYRDIRFGGGIASRFLSVQQFRFSFNCQYSEWFMFDRSPERHHKQIQSLLSGVEIQYAYRIAPVDARIAVSPIFLFDQYSEYTQYYDSSDKSLKNAGVSLGIDLTAYDHLRVYGQGLFAGYWQTKTGVGWVF